MLPFISVVVCTYNRANILKLCLESLVNQAVSSHLYEVIIVDNCSSDNTFEICQFFLGAHFNFRYYFESELGVSYARNRGWQESKGEYIAYIDDDAKAYPDWLFEMFNFISRFPEASVFGGPYDGYSLVKEPAWFPPEDGSLNLGDKDRLIEVGSEWIHGSNLVLRKEVLELNGGFLTFLGPKGEKLCYGEDLRLVGDLNRAGYDVYYASKMRIMHLNKITRMSLWWLLKSCYIEGTSSSKTFDVKYSLISCCKKFAICSFIFFRTIVSFEKVPLKRRVYYALRGLFHSFGLLVEYMSDRFAKR